LTKTRLVSFLCFVWLAGCSESNQVVTLEFRLAEDEPAPGLTEMVVEPYGKSFYLHDRVWVNESDVDSAFVTIQNGRWAVELRLTPQGSDKFEELTGSNVGKRCGMILNGQLVSAPRIMAVIRVGRAIVAGDFGEAEARRVAKRLSRRA
jgi:preprotein translocase subunit SecD